MPLWTKSSSMVSQGFDREESSLLSDCCLLHPQHLKWRRGGGEAIFTLTFLRLATAALAAGTSSAVTATGRTWALGSVDRRSILCKLWSILRDALFAGIKAEREGLKASERSDAAVRDAADKVIHTTKKVTNKADHKTGHPLPAPNGGRTHSPCTVLG